MAKSQEDDIREIRRVQPATSFRRLVRRPSGCSNRRPRAPTSQAATPTTRCRRLESGSPRPSAATGPSGAPASPVSPAHCGANATATRRSPTTAISPSAPPRSVHRSRGVPRGVCRRRRPRDRRRDGGRAAAVGRRRGRHALGSASVEVDPVVVPARHGRQGHPTRDAAIHGRARELADRRGGGIARVVRLPAGRCDAPDPDRRRGDEPPRRSERLTSVPRLPAPPAPSGAGPPVAGFRLRVLASRGERFEHQR
jgi:hypothetical protein